MTVEFIRVCHSIADGVGVAIRTPAGLVVHTGDFKLDQTPVDGEFTDLHRFGDLGNEGVLVLLSDSTNADREGSTPSEKSVGEAFEEIFRRAKRRIIVACFASNIHRIQQVFSVAARLGKKVVVNGKSMVANTRIASELGYLHIPDGTLAGLEELRHLPPEKLLILTTGSQGEPLSAISRMAMGEHKQIHVQEGDTVIISAKVIPGNEKSIARTINHLFKRGAEVIYDEVSPIHVSGHPARDELKLILNLVHPGFSFPSTANIAISTSMRNWQRRWGSLARISFFPRMGMCSSSGRTSVASSERSPPEGYWWMERESEMWGIRCCAIVSIFPRMASSSW